MTAARLAESKLVGPVSAYVDIWMITCDQRDSILHDALGRFI